ncbi:MAG: UDP-2-acetamido-3-amino-2,3-dideoxy-glucuronate N-acetyltransferase [Actinomycetota bacterium]|jgi:acetyltransferase-like isoleucine patch superfamily enzyme|nr:UDP-2-acetamido-3-amino-2,3-dideoxy-glucuronate N-acetyltransferase [Actinomycetota bacterium]
MIHSTAEVSAGADVDTSASVWQFAHVREGARVGRDVVIGRGAYIGPGVVIGDHCKVQNHALVYEPAVVADGVFIGPAVVFTNDRYPRAVNPDGSQKSAADWEPVGVTVLSGASIGARAVCVAPVTIGRWALVAAGSVVVKDVPDFAMVAGAPARRIGWVGPAGEALVEVDGDAGRLVCPRTGARFVLTAPDTLAEAVDE